MYKLKNLAFIAHPRTGSRSCKEVLLSLGAERCNAHHQVCDNAIRDTLYSGGTTACVVRNMFDLLVSWYHNLGREIDFKDFVRECAYAPKLRWFMTPLYHYGLAYCNRLIAYERLESEFNSTLIEAGHTPAIMPWKGKSIRRPFREYYDLQTVRIVEARWALDLQLTGYSWD